MCLIAIANRCVDGQTIVVANRDEFFERPTLQIHDWGNGIVGGQDLRSGGSWMLVRKDGRWAALTNYRGPAPEGGPSRGALVEAAVRSDLSAADHAALVRSEVDQYAGFHLLIDDGNELWVTGTHMEPQHVPVGFHGLSNALLDTPWPKLTSAVSGLESVVNAQGSIEELFALMRDNTRAQEKHLPDTGVPRDLESALSSRFIEMGGEYGTRTTTLWMPARKLLWERTYGADAQIDGEMVIQL